jgi:excisionase family DNA binding protein
VNTNGKPDTLRVTEVARRLGINRCLLYKLCREGKFPHLRLGGRIVVSRAQFERILAEGFGDGTVAIRG